MSQIRSFSPKNEFRFACPVFGAEVRLADCMSLREDHCRNRRTPGRAGCEACMEGSKCPIVRMIQTVHRTGEDPGCYSAEPRVGQLPADVLTHVAPIMVIPSILDRYAVPESERELIMAANEAASSDKRAGARKPIKLAPIAAPAEKPAKAEPEIDMSAAITRAAAREAEAPAKSPERATEAVPAPKPASPAPKKPAPPQRHEIAKSPTPAQAIPKAPVKGISLLELARQRRAASAA